MIDTPIFDALADEFFEQGRNYEGLRSPRKALVEVDPDNGTVLTSEGLQGAPEASHAAGTAYGSELLQTAVQPKPLIVIDQVMSRKAMEAVKTAIRNEGSDRVSDVPEVEEQVEFGPANILPAIPEFEETKEFDVVADFKETPEPVRSLAEKAGPDDVSFISEPEPHPAVAFSKPVFEDRTVTYAVTKGDVRAVGSDVVQLVKSIASCDSEIPASRVRPLPRRTNKRGNNHKK